MRLARQLVALGLLLADRQQPDARPLRTERHACIHAAHDGKLQEMMGTAFDVGAGIEQDGGTLAGRNRRGQRRTVDAGNHAEGGMRRHDRRARVAGAEERGRLLAGDQVGRDANRRTGLFAERHDGRIGHPDRIGRFDHLESELPPVGVRLERRVERVGRTDEGHLHREMTSGGYRAIDDHRRRMIAAHRVNGDPDQTLFLVDRPHLALVVIPAVRADAVRRLRLVALRAETGGRRAQRVVRAPLGGTRLGVSAFWIWHLRIPLQLS